MLETKAIIRRPVGLIGRRQHQNATSVRSRLNAGTKLVGSVTRRRDPRMSIAPPPLGRATRSNRRVAPPETCQRAEPSAECGKGFTFADPG